MDNERGAGDFSVHILKLPFECVCACVCVSIVSFFFCVAKRRHHGAPKLIPKRQRARCALLSHELAVYLGARGAWKEPCLLPRRTGSATLPGGLTRPAPPYGTRIPTEPDQARWIASTRLRGSPSNTEKWARYS